ncbi:MAG TPA: hypothetical protein VM492_04895 [Sumerlaeia bacterium]|nr:hypothetical protein [Sumerlaeia bacterium]
MKQICESCGETIEKPAIAYRMKIEILADPSPPEFTAEDLALDFKEEMARLIEQMSQMDPDEVEDEVYEAYLFTLCAKCRERVHRDLRERHLP